MLQANQVATGRNGVFSDSRSVFALAVLFYALIWGVWIVFHGYGYDNGDAYRLLNTWQVLLSEKRYVPSRSVGYIVAEISHGFAASLGGPLLSNLVTVSFSFVGFFALAGIGRYFEIRAFLPIAAAFFANGAAVVDSSTTTDFMIALGLFSAGFYLLTVDEDVGGIVLMGASAGARMSYIFVALITVFFVLRFRERVLRKDVHVRTYLLYLLSTIFVAGLLYLPVWVQDGLQFDWLNSVRPTEQGFLGLAARWAYKTVMFVSVFGVLGAVAGAVFDRKYKSEPIVIGDEAAKSRRTWFFYYCTAIVVFHILLYLYIPNKADYLLPALLFGAFILEAFGFRFVLIGLTIGELISGLVAIAPLKISYEDLDPCVGILANGATFSPHFSAGPLISNEMDRPENTKCGLMLLKYRPLNINGPLPSSNR